MELNLEQLKNHKKSNRIYILGSGKSILDISDKELEEWEEDCKEADKELKHLTKILFVVVIIAAVLFLITKI